jgi:hypothetical protein
MKKIDQTSHVYAFHILGSEYREIFNRESPVEGICPKQFHKTNFYIV